MNNVIPFVKSQVVVEELTMKIHISEIYAILADGLEEYYLQDGEVITDIDLGLEVDDAGLVEIDVTLARIEDVARPTG